MLEKLGNLIVKRYKMVLVFTLLITIVLGFFMTKLELNMQFMDLLPATDKSVVAYKSALDNFSSLDSIVVGVEGQEGDIRKFLETVPKTVREMQGVRSVSYKSEIDFIEKNGMLMQKKKDLEHMQRAFEASSLKELFAGINDNFENSYISSGDTEKVDKDKTKLLDFLTLINEMVFKTKKGELSSDEADRFFRGEEFFISPDKSLGIFIVKSGISIDDVYGVVNLVNSLEKYLQEEGNKYNLKISLTGTQVITRDEMVISEKDMSITTLLSFAFMLTIFLLAFRLIRYSILALLPLVFGIIWAMGLTYFLTGTLNMMTAMMGAILIGLGIDYSLHIISLFLEMRKKGNSVEESVREVFRKTVKGIITGAITTAIGFLMFGLSDFPGFSEFGIVLGAGIISTLLASIFILPSLLMIFGKKEIKNPKMEFNWIDKIEKMVIGKKVWALAVMVIIIGSLVIRVGKVEFEKDMMKIEAKGLESVSLNRKIIEKFDFSSDNSILISDTIDEAQEKFDEADKLKSVGQISSITMYMPSEEKQLERMNLINEIKQNVKTDSDEEIYLAELSEELFRLEDNIIELSDLAYMGGEESLKEKCDMIIESGVIGNLAEEIDNYAEKISISQSKFIKRLQFLVNNSNSSEIVELKDLPENIIDDFVGKDGSYITTIYPKHDLWNSDFQGIHLKEINTLDENITGTAKIFVKVIDSAASEGKKVLLYTVIAIFIVLLIDFRNFKYATLALIPMITSVIAVLGIMGWTGLKFDVVNIIGVPLIIGIGVDDGVHIIHRYLREKDLLTALRSTGKAVTLTTITTVAAFGTLMIAKYRGFAHLGALLSIGVLMAFFMTIVLLMCLVAIFDKIKLK